MRLQFLLPGLLLLLQVTVLQAGPFGIEKGMSCEELRVIDELNEFSYLVDVEQALPGFDRYVVFCSDEMGVFGLRAYGNSENANQTSNGDFALLRDALTRKYGDPLEASAEEVRRLRWREGSQKRGSARNQAQGDDTDVPRELLRLAEEADYFAIWTAQAGRELPDNVERVVLMQQDTQTKYTGRVSTMRLEYRFANYEAAREKYLDLLSEGL